MLIAYVLRRSATNNLFCRRFWFYSFIFVKKVGNMAAAQSWNLSTLTRFSTRKRNIGRKKNIGLLNLHLHFLHIFRETACFHNFNINQNLKHLTRTNFPIWIEIIMYQYLPHSQQFYIWLYDQKLEMMRKIII